MSNNPQRFRKKPVEIEAIQFTELNARETLQFVGRNNIASADMNIPEFHIFTLEGPHCATVGDWIIKGVKGEFYPCKPDIFAMTYEPVEDNDHD